MVRTILLFGGLLVVVPWGGGCQDDRGGDGEAPSDEALYPRINANIFTSFSTKESIGSQARRLAHYDEITTGGGFAEDYPTRTGLGCRAGETYDFSVRGADNTRARTIFTMAKERNPRLRLLVHATQSKIEISHFDYGTTNPDRWFADSISPKWFAYNPRIPLAVGQEEPGELEVEGDVFFSPEEFPQLTFQFDPDDLRSWVEEQGVYTIGPAPVWTPELRYDFQYLCFSENDHDAARGCFEIMAIWKMDVEGGRIVAAPRRKGGKLVRAVFGTPHTYSAGHQAGILSHSSPTWGAPAFIMNHTEWCPSVDGVTWQEAKVVFVRDFILPVPHVDGIHMDADSEDGIWPGFTMLEEGRYHPDFDLNGVDDVRDDVVRWSIDSYVLYENRLRGEAEAAGRPQFLLNKNGRFLAYPGSGESPFPRPDINGRGFEDFDGGFSGSYDRELKQYRDLFVPGNLHRPVIALVRERNRDYEQKKGMPDFKTHRHILALTLVFGDGSYGHEGGYATRHPELLDNASIGFNGLPYHDFMDEFAVDPNGYGCNHPKYTGEYREEYSHWLGRALVSGPSREVRQEGTSNVAYLREFRGGIAVYTETGGTFSLGGTYKKIKGAPLPQGDPFNDGSVLQTITLQERDGAVLIPVFRPE